MNLKRALIGLVALIVVGATLVWAQSQSFNYTFQFPSGATGGCATVLTENGQPAEQGDNACLSATEFGGGAGYSLYVNPPGIGQLILEDGTTTFNGRIWTHTTPHGACRGVVGIANAPYGPGSTFTENDSNSFSNGWSGPFSINGVVTSNEVRDRTGCSWKWEYTTGSGTENYQHSNSFSNGMRDKRLIPILLLAGVEAILLVLLLYGCSRPMTYRSVLAFEAPSINCVEIEHKIISMVNEYACPQVTATNLTAKAPCDESLWHHIYHQKRLHVLQPCISMTGTMMDATRGREKDGCRHEADGDAHCWIKPDKGQEGLLNDGNIANQDGNLVFEPICRYRVTQPDAISVCKGWSQKLDLPAPGNHIRITGVYVFDAQHKHNEVHPVTSIEVIN